MLKISRTSWFRKDYKRVLKQGKNRNKLYSLVESLVKGEVLERKHKDHKLIGEYKGRRECHIEPDWLLIYKIESDELILE